MIRTRVSMPLVGLVFLLVLAALVALSVAAYRKALPWQATIDVTVRTASAGLGLAPQSQVKINGVEVGEVRSVTSDGERADIRIALEPDRVHLVPANVDAQVVPTTLFGAKHVEFVLPSHPAPDRIAEGAVITQSRGAAEVGQLLTKLKPVLDALDPKLVSTTLSTVARALSGRGRQLGATLRRLQTYLGGLDPHVPQLIDDIRLLGRTADVYDAAAPGLLRILDDTRALSSTLLVPRESAFAAVLRQTATTSDRLETVLDDNGDALATLAGRARPVLSLLAEYSGSYPCVIRGLTATNKVLDNVFGGQGPFVRASVSIVTRREHYSYPRDSPSNPSSTANNANYPVPTLVKNLAPHCSVIPIQVRGVRDTPPFGSAGSAATPGTSTARAASVSATPGSAGRDALTRMIAARNMGTSTAKVPPVAALLLDPLTNDLQVRR